MGRRFFVALLTLVFTLGSVGCESSDASSKVSGVSSKDEASNISSEFESDESTLTSSQDTEPTTLATPTPIPVETVTIFLQTKEEDDAYPSESWYREYNDCGYTTHYKKYERGVLLTESTISYFSDNIAEQQSIVKQYYEDGILSSETTTDYDEEGNRIRVRSITYDDNGVILSDVTTDSIYELNPDNKPDVEEECEYDSEGRCISKKRWWKRSGKSEFTTYEYFDNGDYIVNTLNKDETVDESCKYNKDGRMLEKRAYSKNGGLVALTQYNEDGSGEAMGYDSAGNVTKKYHFDSDGIYDQKCEIKDGVEFYTLSTEYNSDGKALSQTLLNDDGELVKSVSVEFGDGYEIRTKKITEAKSNILASPCEEITKYEFDGDRLIRSTTDYSSDTAGQNHQVIEYGYDSNNRLISKIDTRNGVDVGTENIFKYYWTYDEYGNSLTYDEEQTIIDNGSARTITRHVECAYVAVTVPVDQAEDMIRSRNTGTIPSSEDAIDYHTRL